ncbi:hypothetical protein AB0M87_21010 [Streptomyces sp. NPDC051320]|uniref:hypothetical protein n=1 Tax=Streptomyces sp. NPDC051320 TaxID=3154644 RepID=UPI00341A6DC9
MLCEGHGPSHRAPPARRPAQPPHLQRRVRPGDRQRRGHRRDQEVVPDARIDLPTGGAGRRTYLDITRIQQDTGYQPDYDTGYQPDYDTERAAADYIAWLRAGNEH